MVKFFQKITFGKYLKNNGQNIFENVGKLYQKNNG